MNGQEGFSYPGEKHMGDRQGRMWIYLTLVTKWRKFVIVNFLIVCCVAVVLSFLLPKWYTAETTLLPPSEQPSATLGLASMLSELPIAEFGLPGMTTPSEIFKAILESRTVAQAIVKDHDLMKVYRKETMEYAIEVLWNRSTIEITEEGLIRISVEERDPVLASAVANSFVQELDRVNQRSSISQAKNTRIFVEDRLAETRENLKDAEDALRRFQEENGTISLPEQTMAIIESAAQLRVQQMTLEVERGVLLKTLSGKHPQVDRIKSEIDEIAKQLHKITLGEDQSADGPEPLDRETQTDLNIPLAEVPSIGLQLARLTREVKIQEAIFELLTQQFEQSKIQEAKDTPTVQVLDTAIPPERRSRPVRRKIVLFGAGLSIFLSFVFISCVEYVNGLREKRQEDYRRLESLLDILRSDVRWIQRKMGLRRRTGS